MDMKNYLKCKNKLVETLKSTILELFNEHCKEYLHVVATIGITPDSQICSSVLFNLDDKLVKKDQPIDQCSDVNTTNTVSIALNVCHLPVEQENERQNDAENQFSELALTLENCPERVHEVKEESVAVCADECLSTDNNHNSVATESEKDTVPCPLITFSKLESDDGDTTVPIMEQTEMILNETASSLEPPVLEKQVELSQINDPTEDNEHNLDAQEPTENVSSVFVLSPDCSSDSMVVFDLSPNGPQLSNTHSCDTTEVTPINSSSDPLDIPNSCVSGDMVEFLKMKDTATNVGDTSESVWRTNSVMTPEIKRCRHQKFVQLLNKSSSLNVEARFPTQTSASSFFLALADQLTQWRNHPKHGMSHSQLRSEFSDFMTNLEEAQVGRCCQFVQGGRASWKKYVQIIRTESSLGPFVCFGDDPIENDEYLEYSKRWSDFQPIYDPIDHLSVVLASEFLDVNIRLISMVSDPNKSLVLKETLISNKEPRPSTVILGEYLTHHYQSLQVKANTQHSSNKNPRVKLKRLTKKQMPQINLKKSVGNLGPRNVVKKQQATSKRTWKFPERRKKRKACGKCAPCKITKDCGKCFNCRHKEKARNKCKLKKCIKLLKM